MERHEAKKSLSLEEYAAQHPRQEPPQIVGFQPPPRTIKEREQDRETVCRIKANILQELERGKAPELLLYSAVRAVGILTQDQAWADAVKEKLDGVYSDLAQQSLFTDNAAEAARRLESMRTEFEDKLRRQTQMQLNKIGKLEKALREVQRMLEPEEPEEPEEQGTT